MSSIPTVASIPPSGVTGNVLNPPGGYAAPPGPLTLDAEGNGLAEVAIWLDGAAPLALDARAATVGAIALVNEVAGMVVAGDATRRGPKLRAKMTEAVAAIVGGLLKQWSRIPPRPVYRSRKAEGFSNGPVASRQFNGAMKGLVRLGLVVMQPGYRRANDYGFAKLWFGKAARYWPSAELLRLASSHGVIVETVLRDFVSAAPPNRPLCASQSLSRR